MAFIDTLAADAEAHPDQRRYFLTFAGQRGATTLTQPVMDLVAFQRAVDAALRHRGFSGVFSFEFDIVKRCPPLTDHLVLFHCHGVARPDDPAAFAFTAVRQSLLQSSAFPSWRGAAGAHIKTIGQLSLDVHRVGNYLADPFHQLKRLQPDKRHPRQTRLRSTREGLTQTIILRAAEIQSAMSVRDTVFGVGEFGRLLRREWWQRFQQALPAPPRADVIGLSGVNVFWRHVHARKGTGERF